MAALNQKALTEIVEGSGVRYKRNAVSYIFTCPHCTKSDKLYIRRKDGRFICFYCAEINGYKGRCDRALADLIGTPRAELAQQLFGEGEQQATLTLEIEIAPWDSDVSMSDTVIPEAPVMGMPLDFLPLDHKGAERGRAYVEDRRAIPLSVASEYGIRYSPPQRRVIFPVIVDGKCRGWQARAILDEIQPKILSSRHIPRSDTLMFYDRLGFHEHCVLTEGPVDAIKAHLCGGNVATMGKIVTPNQIELIRRKGVKKLYLGLDRDASTEAMKLIQEVSSDFEIYHLTPPEGVSDLGECSFEQVYERFVTAPRLDSASLLVYIRAD